MESTYICYPALVYKNKNKNVFVANCIIKKLVGFGQTEYDAVLNLENILNNTNPEFPVKVKPVNQMFDDLNSEIKKPYLAWINKKPDLWIETNQLLEDSN